MFSVASLRCDCNNCIHIAALTYTFSGIALCYKSKFIIISLNGCFLITSKLHLFLTIRINSEPYKLKI